MKDYVYARDYRKGFTYCRRCKHSRSVAWDYSSSMLPDEGLHHTIRCGVNERNAEDKNTGNCKDYEKADIFTRALHFMDLF